MSQGLETTRTTEDDEDAPASPYRLWRYCMWSGWVYLFLLGLGWAGLAGFLPPPPESWSAAEVKHFFLEDNGLKRAGMLLYICASPLYVVFSIVVSRLLKRIEGPYGILYQVEFYGGIAGAALGQITGLFWLAAAFRTAQLSAENVQLLNDLGWFCIDLFFMTPVLQMVAVGIVVVRDRSARPLFPTWVAWASFGLAAAQFPLILLPFLMTGPFAWNGLINFWAVLNAFFLWVCLMIVMGQRAVAELDRRGAPPTWREDD